MTSTLIKVKEHIYQKFVALGLYTWIVMWKSILLNLLQMMNSLKQIKLKSSKRLSLLKLEIVRAQIQMIVRLNLDCSCSSIYNAYMHLNLASSFYLPLFFAISIRNRKKKYSYLTPIWWFPIDRNFFQLFFLSQLHFRYFKLFHLLVNANNVFSYEKWQ